MPDHTYLRELLTPCCPLGTADSLVLEWVQGGSLFRVKHVGDYFLDVAPLMVNHRLCETYAKDEEQYRRSWCYTGTGTAPWLAAVLSAAMWDGGEDTEPMGWNKSNQTQEWRDLRGGQTWESSHAVATYVEALDANGWPEK